MNPTAHAKANGINPPDNRRDAGDYIWGNSTISHMLSRPEYLGHTVNFKTYRKSYKQKKQLHNDPSEWQVFKNTHEAIIDQKTFDIVQRIRDGRRRVTPMGEMPALSGMVFCADCGAKMYQVLGRSLPQSEYMVCATYRKKGKEVCPSHQIRNSVIEKFLLAGIREIAGYAQANEEEFVEMITKKSRAEVDRSLRDGKRELEQSQARIHKLDEIIQRLYEDNIEGKISDERFVKMSENYETEQKTLECRVTELRGLDCRPAGKQRECRPFPRTGTQVHGRPGTDAGDHPRIRGAHRVELHRGIHAAAERRKNGIAAFHDYADISGIIKSLSCTAFKGNFLFS